MIRRLLGLLCAAACAPLLAPPSAAHAQAQAAAAACAPDGAIGYVCGLSNVEDLVAVPGGRWILGSAMQAGAGGAYLIDASAHAAKIIPITFGQPQKPYDPACPAPDMKLIRLHGLELRSTADGTRTLYAVNHGGRESIEVFDVDAVAREPKLTWQGCLILPAGAVPNAVAALPGGSLAVTKFLDADDKDGIVTVMNGGLTGLVYIWKPGAGFKALAGSKMAGANGIVTARDNKFVFVNDYGGKAVWKIPLDGSGKTSKATVDFHPDNLRWAPDGKISVTGQFFDLSNRNGLHGWAAVKLDPAAMTTTPYVKVDGNAKFDNGTTALQVGKELWIGTFRGDRVAYMPAP